MRPLTTLGALVFMSCLVVYQGQEKPQGGKPNDPPAATGQGQGQRQQQQGQVFTHPREQVPRFQRPREQPPQGHHHPDRPGMHKHWHPWHGPLYFAQPQAPTYVLPPTFQLPAGQVTYYRAPATCRCPWCDGELQVVVGGQ